MVGDIKSPECGAGNTKNFKVKFSFDGNYYFWVIDDVAIVPMESNNLQANQTFFAPAENIFTPCLRNRGKDVFSRSKESLVGL